MKNRNGPLSPSLMSVVQEISPFWRAFRRIGTLAFERPDSATAKNMVPAGRFPVAWYSTRNSAEFLPPSADRLARQLATENRTRPVVSRRRFRGGRDCRDG